LFFNLSIATYIDNLNDLLVKRFQFSYVTAGYFLFIPYGLAAAFSFLIGKVLNKIPTLKRKIIVFGSILYSVGILASFLLPNIDKSEPVPSYYYGIVGIQFLTISLMMSILYGCLSSSIKYVVDENHLGVGWGVIGSTVGLS
jgi:MFS family permease